MRKDNRHSEELIRPSDQSSGPPARCLATAREHNFGLHSDRPRHSESSAIELLLLHKSVVDDE